MSLQCVLFVVFMHSLQWRCVLSFVFLASWRYVGPVRLAQHYMEGNGFGVNPSFPVGSLTIATNWHTQWVDMGCGLGMAQPLATPNPQPYSIIDAGVGLFLGLDDQMLN